jgi:hypothetical protein
LFVIDAGKCFRPPPPGVAVLQNAGYRTPFAVESPFCNTVSPGLVPPLKAQRGRMLRKTHIASWSKSPSLPFMKLHTEKLKN